MTDLYCTIIYTPQQDLRVNCDLKTETFLTREPTSIKNTTVFSLQVISCGPANVDCSTSW